MCEITLEFQQIDGMLYLYLISHRRSGSTVSDMEGTSSWKEQPRDREKQQCSHCLLGLGTMQQAATPPCLAYALFEPLQEHPSPWDPNWDLAIAAGCVWAA